MLEFSMIILAFSLLGLLLEVLAWHLAAAVMSAWPRGLPILYQPFAWVWRKVKIWRCS